LVSDIKEGTQMRVSVNRMLRRIFGSRRDEVTGGSKKLHKEELHILYSAKLKLRRIDGRAPPEWILRLKESEMGRTCRKNGEKRNTYRLLV
jgi:hypothetical protein